MWRASCSPSAPSARLDLLPRLEKPNSASHLHTTYTRESWSQLGPSHLHACTPSHPSPSIFVVCRVPCSYVASPTPKCSQAAALTVSAGGARVSAPRACVRTERRNVLP